MLLSILAGVMIGIGAIIYLTVGGVAGALLFAVGLMTICHFQLHLFTGKAGLLITNEITPWQLIKIWFGNLIGTGIASALMFFTPKFAALSEAATAITTIRIENGPIANLILGIFCGILMTCAVEGYKTSSNMLFIYIPIAVFILSGYNHSIADQFYAWTSDWENLTQILNFITISLIPTTIGNVIGCNIIPICKKN